MPQIPATTGVLVILGLWAVIAILSVVVPLTIPVPPLWFDAWTKLAATAALGLRVLWVAPKQLQEYLNKKS
jgi:hypothetical protein